MELSDKIWTTRKNRINTENRLKANAIVSQVLISYYSVFLIIFSILGYSSNDKSYSMLALIGSIVLLAISIHLWAQKYGEKSIIMRDCYTDLQKLESSVKRAEENDDKDLLDKLNTNYCDMLNKYENHSEYDYLCTRFSFRREENTTLPAFTRLDLFSFILRKLFRYSIISVFFISPLIGLYILYTLQ